MTLDQKQATPELCDRVKRRPPSTKSIFNIALHFLLLVQTACARGLEGPYEGGGGDMGIEIGGGGNGGGLGGGTPTQECTSGQTQSCYTGPTSTIGIGACRSGVQICDNNGSWNNTTCTGEVTPTAEVCGNNVDDNCDNMTDTEDPAAGCCKPSVGLKVCYDGPDGTKDEGECETGTSICQADGKTFGPCMGQTTPTAEICDGLDNDCNGETDEGNPGGGEFCSTGLEGPCESGERTCLQGALQCKGPPPGIEVCDNVDNDCDGQIDESLPFNFPCFTKGIDCNIGTQKCHNGEIACICN